MSGENVIPDFLKLLKQKKGTGKARVGILNDTPRSDGKSNAEIGQKHEFGIGVPQRSFLRMPIANFLEERLFSYGAGFPSQLEKVVNQKSFKPWLNTIGAIAKSLVDDAFASNGFNQWAPLSLYTISKKGHAQILIDTHELSKSISYDVIDG
jgi:hypothetical protein